MCACVCMRMRVTSPNLNNAYEYDSALLAVPALFLAAFWLIT
jgi:hypothetical protein